VKPDLIAIYNDLVRYGMRPLEACELVTRDPALAEAVVRKARAQYEAYGKSGMPRLTYDSVGNMPPPEIMDKLDAYFGKPFLKASTMKITGSPWRDLADSKTVETFLGSIDPWEVK